MQNNIHAVVHDITLRGQCFCNVHTYKQLFNTIVLLCVILQTHKGINLMTPIAFLDHVTAFDTVIRNTFWKVMADEGFHNAT